MQKLHTDTHPIEVLLLGAWLALEAAAVLLTALVALLLTLARWRPAAPLAPKPKRPRVATPRPVSPSPAPWPLALQAAAALAGLEPLTVTQLHRLARAAGLPRQLSRTGRRAALLQALAGLEVAMV